MKVYVITKRQLYPMQEAILLDNYEIINTGGWTLEEINTIASKLLDELAKGNAVVFNACEPALMKMLVNLYPDSVFVFHNDKRNENNAPAPTGWQII